MKKKDTASRKWVSRRFLARHYDVSETTIWRWVKAGILPEPEEITPTTKRYDFEKIIERDMRQDSAA